MSLSLFPSGTQCVVVSAFTSENDSELSVQQGDIVTVVYVSDDGWWMVKRFDDPEKQGLVPSVCLKDKEEAEVAPKDPKEKPDEPDEPVASNSDEGTSYIMDGCTHIHVVMYALCVYTAMVHQHLATVLTHINLLLLYNGYCRM